ncbi:hypothetical protein QLS71_016800 [Mariniflexile litorale]|uniref:SGNH/GDSL hydrolase family protein n=1 Tax=Mariniflexile litorale TaxID=3045158 RepID=A0AAU7EEG7_9FLAO|nr:hypothetical protein [Mariniflexile sp. KMM 9835]MDQ8211503.1 hypothetical protein [Mariniflexile sp. KMM 9835]
MMKKFLLQVLGFIAVFFLLNFVVGYLYNIPVKESIKNKTHKNYLKYSKIHDPSNKYNLVFLGSSRGYTAYNPVIFDSILKTKSFNMCTSSQNVIESYYVLKDILQHQKPTTMVYEMFLQSFDTTDDYYQILSNASFFESTQLKQDMIINGFGLTGISNYLSPILCNKLYIKAAIMGLIAGGNDTASNNKKTSYWVAGYLHEEKEVSQHTINNFEKMVTPNNTAVSEKKLEYFKKIVALCKENNIELVCVRSPYPPTRLQNEKIQNLNALSEYFKNLCLQNQVTYYDFNTVENRSFKYLDTDFSDSHHMNYKGANKISVQLSEILKQ